MWPGSIKVIRTAFKIPISSGKGPFLYYVRVFLAFSRPPIPVGIVSILIYHPQILHKIFENHLPPRKKNQTDITLLEYVNVQSSHLYSLIMWQMVRTKDIFYEKYQSFTSKVTD